MEYSVITSRNNDKIKYVGKLVSDASLRRSDSIFVLEGARLCADAERSGYTVEEVFVTEKALGKYGEMLTALLAAANKVFLITEPIAQKLSDTVNTQGVFCTVREKSADAIRLQKGKRYVALENVQNPQNFGSVARTAEALGIDAIITFEGCDMYNPKLLRASMGSVLRIPLYRVSDLSALIEEANKIGIPTVATVPDSSAQDITEIDFSQGALTVIGNEGNGVSEEIQSLCSVRATIVMKGKAESLNASAAAAIAMWEMVR